MYSNEGAVHAENHHHRVLLRVETEAVTRCTTCLAQKDSAMRAPKDSPSPGGSQTVAASQGRVNPSHVQVKLVDEVLLRMHRSRTCRSPVNKRDMSSKVKSVSYRRRRSVGGDCMLGLRGDRRPAGRGTGSPSSRLFLRISGSRFTGDSRTVVRELCRCVRGVKGSLVHELVQWFTLEPTVNSEP